MFCQFYMTSVHFNSQLAKELWRLCRWQKGDHGKNIFCKEWKYIDNKSQVITQSQCAGKLVGSSVRAWDIVLTHVNIKPI